MPKVVHVRARSQKNNVTSLYLLVTKEIQEGEDIYGYDVTQTITEDLKKDRNDGFPRHHGRAFAWGVTQVCEAGRIYQEMRKLAITNEDRETPVLHEGWWRTIKADRVEEIGEYWEG